MLQQTKNDAFKKAREKLGNELVSMGKEANNPDNVRANELFEKVKSLNWVMGQNDKSPHYKAPYKPTYRKAYK